jgi:hypothetical protein
MLLAVAGDERPVSALFATFRSFLVRFSCLDCFGAEALGLSAPRDRSSFLPTLTATPSRPSPDNLSGFGGLEPR